MHMIDQSNDRDNIAYIGQTPWHGLGVSMPDGADLDQWRIAAGLEWEAKRGDAYFRNDKGHLKRAENQFLYRSDTGDTLGYVTPRYKVVQPADVVEFYRDLCDHYGFAMETLGALDDGKRVWALAKTDGFFRLKGQDEVRNYLLLATSYDGKMSTRAQFTSVRVVCHNTLSYATHFKDGISIGHSRQFNADQVKLDSGIYGDEFQQFEANAEKLADVGVNKSAAVRFLVDLFESEDVKVEDLSTRKANIIQNVYGLFDGKGMGADYKAAKGTAWGLVNAVTEFVDHQQGHTDNTRIKSAWFGLGNKLKRDAMDRALKLAA